MGTVCSHTMGVMEQIGRYRLVARLGAGSFATVWQGHDDQLDVPVAIKVLAENWSSREDVRNRFMSEARLMRRIQDSRVIRVYDVGTLQDGRPYFVMDYCDSGSLDQWRRELRPPAQAIRAAAQACRALQVLHDHHVVHRDVTPGNLLLDSSSDGSLVVRLADLGVAKSMLDDLGSTMTAGTPSYMALEQATGGNFDHRADIYAMGCVTYALLTGAPPFRVRNLPDLLNRQEGQHPEALAGRLGVPAELDELLRRALSRAPQGRPASAKAMADQLDRIAGAIEAGGTEPGRTSIAFTHLRTPAPAWPTMPIDDEDAALTRRQPAPRRAAEPPSPASSATPAGQPSADRPAASVPPPQQPVGPISGGRSATPVPTPNPARHPGPLPPAAGWTPPRGYGQPQGSSPAPHRYGEHPAPTPQWPGQMVNDWSYLPPERTPTPSGRGAGFWWIIAVAAFLILMIVVWVIFQLT